MLGIFTVEIPVCLKMQLLYVSIYLSSHCLWWASLNCSLCAVSNLVRLNEGLCQLSTYVYHCSTFRIYVERQTRHTIQDLTFIKVETLNMKGVHNFQSLLIFSNCVYMFKVYICACAFVCVYISVHKYVFVTIHAYTRTNMYTNTHNICVCFELAGFILNHVMVNIILNIVFICYLRFSVTMELFCFGVYQQGLHK